MAFKITAAFHKASGLEKNESEHIEKTDEGEERMVEQDECENEELPGERIASPLEALNKMAKRPRVDIEFQDLTYMVQNRHDGNREKRAIIKGISGAFRSGELTAILGPSGAGKSSLMNILVGYTTTGVTGDILVNGQPREMRLYHKISSYIMQDHLMQPRLSVHEAMLVAAHLKLGSELTHKEKLLVVDEVLNTLGLTVCRNTRTENLSGGQIKRLSIALELVNNPPVIFIDEPTSGLDVFAIKQCISLLKMLTKNGRTIICTIHQPSASIFSLFDNVYLISKGKCVYQGAPDLMVSFLSNLEFHCPKTHNPADFILETLQSNYENTIIMSKSIENGRISQHSPSLMLTEDLHTIRKDSKQIIIGKDIPGCHSLDMEFPTSFWTQFRVLLKRMLLQRVRNETSLWMQFSFHLMSGILLGSLFYNIGNDGRLPIANFKFCLSILIMFSYNSVMIPILILPTEVTQLQREYFNRWYGLKAYYAALTFANLPTMFIFEMVFLILTYYISGQLLELDRFVLFCIASMLTAMCSEGFGYAIGSLFSVTNGSILGPALLAPPLVVCVYGIGFGTSIETVMKILMRLSYLRYGISALVVSLYRNREKLDCEDLYCHYDDPAVFLKDIGMEGTTYLVEITGLLSFVIFYRFLAYFFLRYRIQHEFSSKLLTFISKLLRRK